MMSLRIHNILDYAIGVFLIICPWMFTFNDIPRATDVYLVLGSSLILYSLFTHYEYSVAPLVSLGVHMTFDAMVGLALILAPTFFDYRGLLTPEQEALHYFLGLGAFGLVVLTKPRSEREMREITGFPLHHT